MLNQVYANMLNKPVLVLKEEVTSLESGIFAFLAAGAFKTVEEAQQKLCPRYRTFNPEPAQVAVYPEIYPLYQKLYFGFGNPRSEGISVGEVLRQLRKIAAKARTVSSHR